MNNDFNFEFKDKEIAKVTTNITKESRREFGRTFKSAAEAAKKDSGAIAADVTVDTVNGATPAGALEVVMPSSPDSPSPIPDENHEERIAPILSPSLSANDSEKELYAIAKPLRTYERDIADAIREKNESIASINIAAQLKKQGTEKTNEPTHRSQAERASRTGLVVLISLILVLASASFVAISYYFYSINKPTQIVETNTSIIATDTRISVDVTDLKNDGVVSEIKKILTSESSAGVVVEISMTAIQTDSEKNELRVPMLVTKFFEIFARSSPPALARALGPEWMFGFQQQNGLNGFFILTRVQSFDTSFGGMLSWEKDMLTNLSQILPRPEVVVANTGHVFTDTIIRNKDVRVLKDSFGNIVLMYSFLDSKNLLIATNEQTFREILGRFFSSQIVR